VSDALQALPQSAAEQARAASLRRVILVLTVVNVLNYMDRFALSVLAPKFQAELSISDGELGLLVGFAFSLFYAVAGIPIARWADRGVRRNIIAAAIAVWSAMTALCGAAQSFAQLLAARVGVAAGEAGGLSPGQSILCDYVPFEKRAGVLAIHSLGLFIGMMLGMALAGWLGEAIGWRLTFVALGLPGIAVALLVLATVREPQRGFFDPHHESESRSLLHAISLLWKSTSYRLLLVAIIANGFAQFGLNQWLPSLYARSFSWDSATLGVSLGVTFGIGQGIGLLLGGVGANRVARRDSRLPLRIGANCVLLAAPASLAALFAPSARESIVLMALAGFLWNIPGGATAAAVFSVVPAGIRTTAGTITVFFTSLLGFGLGPSSVGLLSDALTHSLGTEALRYAMILPVSFIPLTAGALALASRYLPSDLGQSVPRADSTVHRTEV
jgi:predicted MFS family arabinose efflux permease